MTDFGAAVKALNEAQVRYIIVGALAARLHGGGMSTDDLDLCYERTKQNMERLANVLAGFKPSLRGAPDVPFILDARTLSNGMNFTFRTKIGDIDILGSLSGVGGYDELAKDAVVVEFEGLTCQVASLDAIIRSKRAAGRAKDKLMLPELEAMLELRPDDDSGKPK